MKTLNVTKTVHQRLGEHILADGYNIVMDIEKSHGSYLVDKNGKKYLDFFSMFASSPIGYNHPHLVKNEAFLGKMAVNKLAVSDIYTEEFADFVDTFARVAMPKELQYSFFISGGTLAVENALKAAFDWRTRLNFTKGIEEEADQVIHFKQAFHGRSGYTLSLTNTNDPRKYEYFPKFNWPRIENPKMFFPVTDENTQQTIEAEKKAVAQIHEALRNNPNRVACIIIETIQGEGGDNYFRPEFLQKLRAICDENEILLIFDEVQTGIGMTGKMWAYQHYEIIPDIISFGKKAQVCGILANKEKLDQIPNNVFKESSRINSTFGGNFIDMIRFKLILEVIEKENLVENACVQGEYFLQKLHELQSQNPTIKNVRGKGLFIAFDLENGQLRDEFIRHCFDNQLIVLPCGEKSVRFRPHLNVTQEQIDQAVEIMKAL
ncbi:Probable L-lysine-epsilon aminotransferase [Weeksella virosa]|uniref:L-lysine 6-transaminase n=1 Tax=Weeksella virosa TaxID=1014 RepID=UPI000DFA0EF8|nr:L-lysine 6-transaminase [Weeksella virosa]SUP53232.1 Probable L-lysine-epsilon aminotransferase [Weeksella virosa]